MMIKKTVLETIFDTDKKVKTALFSLVTVVVLLYLYRWKYLHYEHIDTAWTASLTYDFIHKKSPIDTVYGGGLATLDLFGQIPGFFYAFFLDIFGWEVYTISLISTALGATALFFWFFNFKEIGLKRKEALFTLFLIALSYPFLFSTHSARTDMFLFFLFSVTIFLFFKKFYLPAGILALIAFEGHPMGITLFFYLLPWIIVKRETLFCSRVAFFRSLALFLFGCLIGVGIYLALHFPYLATENFEKVKSVAKEGGNYLFVFFFNPIIQFIETPSYSAKAGGSLVGSFQLFFQLLYVSRNVFLLLLALLLVGTGFKRGVFKKVPYLSLTLLFLIISSLMTRRGNPFYFVLFLPIFMALISYSASRLRLLSLTTFILLLLLGGQYLLFFLFYEDSPHNLKESHTYRQTITSTVPDDTLPLYGSYNDWFIFKERDFSVYSSFRKEATPPDGPFYFIDKDDKKMAPEELPSPSLLDLYKQEEVGTFFDSWYGQVTVYKFEKK